MVPFFEFTFALHDVTAWLNDGASAIPLQNAQRAIPRSRRDET
jgi:hypothetical protein